MCLLGPKTRRLALYTFSGFHQTQNSMQQNIVESSISEIQLIFYPGKVEKSSFRTVLDIIEVI